MTVDTQEIYQTLVKGGFTEEQAGTVIDVMRSIDLSHLATKADLEKLEQSTKADLAPIKADLMLLKWMMAFILAGIGSLIANTFFG